MHIHAHTHTHTHAHIHTHNFSISTINWSTNLSPVTVRPFTKHVGPTLLIPHSPLETFLLIFTTAILQWIVDQSNQYASQCMGDRFDTWQQITIEEMKAFMGFMILMGVVKLPSLADYWKRDEIFHYAPIASRITRDRFFDIQRYLHFADNSTLAALGADGYDRLGKIRPIIDMINEQLLMLYHPHKEVSVDEAMIPFKGRSSMKQFMPKKPVKRGFKIWARADSTNGYISEFFVYTGKEGDRVETGLGSNVVITLTQQLTNLYHHVYFDNYFNSMSLLLKLLKAGIYGCGTLRINRKGCPADLKAVAKKGFSERGHSKTWQYENMTVTVWQDSKPVVVAATNSDPTLSMTVARKQKDGSRVSVTSPASVALYNQYMGGVDHNDQLRGYYHVRLKCRKYYKYIFWFIFDLAITNAYILCKHHTDLAITDIKTFRVALAKELIGGYCSRKRSSRPTNQQASKKFCPAHFPVRGSDKNHRCHYCHLYRKERHETKWFCQDCGHFFCHNGTQEDCFYLYHTKYVSPPPV